LPGWLCRLAGALLVLMLAGCAPYDAGEARLCQEAVPAIERHGAIRILATQAYGERDDTLDVAYQVLDGTGAQVGFERVLRCSFSRIEAGMDRRIVSLIAYDGPASATELQLLNRFWLGDPEAVEAGWRRVTLADTVYRGLDPRLAYALQLGLAGLPQAVVYALVAAAFALILSLTGQIHLAIGQTAMTGAYGALFTALFLAERLPGIAGAALVVGALAGGVVAAAALGRLVGGLFLGFTGGRGLAFMVASIGLAIAIDEALRLFAANTGLWIPTVLNAPFVVFAGDFPVVWTPVQMIVTGLGAATVAGLVGILPQVAFGRRLRAGADDPVMAELLGIDMRRLRVRVFMLSGALAGVAGALYTLAYAGGDHSASMIIGLKGLFAATLGGGSPALAVIGGLVIGLMENYWTGYLGADGRDIAVLTLLAVVLAVRARDPLRR
jgi:branched-chain amino acid transport system permease protein